jgi:hypothetical protein
MGDGSCEADTEGLSGDPLDWLGLAFSSTNLVFSPLEVCASCHFTILIRRDTCFIRVFGIAVVGR